MRLDEDEKPSTSRTYLPYEEKENDEPLFGYSRTSAVEPPPWKNKRYNLSIEGLHDEILDVYDWLKPSLLETNVRTRVFEKVEAAIKARWKDCDIRVSVFGSLRTQLFLPTSDIDVLVECADWQDKQVTRILEDTAAALHATGMAETISVYGDAFVPIVKMVDKDTRVSIDISFNTVQGVKAADYIEKVKEEFPVVEPLVLILKQFLIQRNLNQTFTGGLSSYGLILMLINFLQLYALAARGKGFRDDGINLGELLMRFFEVYSEEFNYMEVGISVNDIRYRPKSDMPNRESVPVFSLEDPLLSTNEVGRSTFNFAGVQTAFAQALQLLKGVFVRDRKRSALFNEKIYRGSMLSMIMPFTSKQIRFRNWLKSFSLSYPAENVRTSQLVTNTFLAPVIDLATVRWRAVTLAAPKPLKRLIISKPTEEGAETDETATAEPVVAADAKFKNAYSAKKSDKSQEVAMSNGASCSGNQIGRNGSSIGDKDDTIRDSDRTVLADGEGLPASGSHQMDDANQAVSNSNGHYYNGSDSGIESLSIPVSCKISSVTSTVGTTTTTTVMTTAPASAEATAPVQQGNNTARPIETLDRSGVKKIVLVHVEPKKKASLAQTMTSMVDSKGVPSSVGSGPPSSSLQQPPSMSCSVQTSSSSSASAPHPPPPARKAWTGGRDLSLFRQSKSDAGKKSSAPFSSCSSNSSCPSERSSSASDDDVIARSHQSHHRTPSPSENTTPPGEFHLNAHSDGHQSTTLLRVQHDNKSNGSRSRSNSNGESHRPRTFANAVYRNSNRGPAQLPHQTSRTKASTMPPPAPPTQSGKAGSAGNQGAGVSKRESKNHHHQRGNYQQQQNQQSNGAQMNGNYSTSNHQHHHHSRQQQNGSHHYHRDQPTDNGNAVAQHQHQQPARRMNGNNSPHGYAQHRHQRGSGSDSGQLPPNRSTTGNPTKHSAGRNMTSGSSECGTSERTTSDGESSERDSLKSGGGGGGFKTYKRRQNKGAMAGNGYHL